MAQLSDVAKRAGVSTASVSRVLNHPDKVSARIREKVTLAMEELGYVRDGAARALASRRSYSIGSVVPTIGIGIFASGVERLQQRLQEYGYQLLIATTQYDASKEIEAVRSLIERGVDGVQLVGQQHDPRIYALLQGRGIPYVNSYQYDPDNEHPCIGFDNYRSAWELMRHLMELGHRDVGIVTSPTRLNDRIAARLRGMLACLKSYGVDQPKSRIIEVPHRLADGRSAARALMRAHPQITAICGTADALAIGALFELRTMGIAVPGEVSVAGYDDLEIVRHLDPTLTTVHVPVEEIGVRVADYLLGCIEGRAMPMKTELEANLVLRDSTARARTVPARMAAGQS
ncbi:LacI family DNA-binding transcriptional regulator [Oceanibaculum nanhaiense]|uniref:LacI family DNA-binding transcriptional regulator n=1 Tax=Oceanibaculum nanhaiense TaxID=1909734 RepID=UPI00396EC9AC